VRRRDLSHGAPQLSLRLAPSKRRSLRASVAGANVPWVAATRFFVNERRVAIDTLGPFRAVLAQSVVGPSATIRVHVKTRDGRSVTLSHRASPRP